jgi:hypothetical protein
MTPAEKTIGQAMRAAYDETVTAWLERGETESGYFAAQDIADRILAPVITDIGLRNAIAEAMAAHAAVLAFRPGRVAH